MNQLDELRDIIVGDSSEQLAELKERIENVEQRTSDVAEVLSPAIDKEVRSGNPTLAIALQKPVSLGLKRAIRSEPEEYAEILYPVMAPSIRRAIAQAISSMMVTINRTIESATTVQGLSLRYQSLRSGIPYGELALRKSLLYRVEHVYLIHRDTGMAIESVHGDDKNLLDTDAIGAMFSAIQSFVQESFSQDDSGRLTDLKVGDQNVWVAHGPKAMLACVIRGEAPVSLKRELYDTLDAVRTGFGNAIVDFDGDCSAFDGVDELLQPLLLSELKDNLTANSKGSSSKNQSWGPLILGFFCLAMALYFAFQFFINSSKVSTVEHFLRETPGVATTALYWSDGKLVVEGLQDPDAVIPYETLKSYDIHQEDLEFNMIPFRSLELDMELQRFRTELSLPRGVYLSVRNNKIELYGKSPLRWLLENDVRIRQLAADRRLSIAELSPSLVSVSDILISSFPRDILRTLSMSEVVRDERTVLEIGGQMDAVNLALLQAMFAGNRWVMVTASAR
ncbi:hypothetical protein NBRC116583_09400 [Arenicella sp. 4NH20-0111]|uniref:hypothetical protein n=1 Tax=Arenicella sp. 4NH20-0111 TaxID=3127648 RepID=UPI003108EFD4